MCADKLHGEYSLSMADNRHVLVMIVLRVRTISGTAYVQIEHTHGIQVHIHASMAKGCNMILAWHGS
jgi:UDP-galactopyranose mutase